MTAEKEHKKSRTTTRRAKRTCSRVPLPSWPIPHRTNVNNRQYKFATRPRVVVGRLSGGCFLLRADFESPVVEENWLGRADTSRVPSANPTNNVAVLASVWHRYDLSYYGNHRPKKRFGTLDVRPLLLSLFSSCLSYLDSSLPHHPYPNISQKSVLASYGGLLERTHTFIFSVPRDQQEGFQHIFHSYRTCTT